MTDGAPPSIAIIIPVLHRPHRVEPLMANVAAATELRHRLLFVASPGDHSEIAALEAARADFMILDHPPGPGDYARKINAGYRHTTEPLIFCGADDLRFHPGWDRAAVRKLRPGVGFVGTNDLGNPRVIAGRHSTHSLVTRAYADEHGVIDQPGAIYSEAYPHEFCDDEAVATAKHRGAWAFAADSRVEHLHPHWGKAATDQLYDAAPDRLEAGRRVFHARRPLWGVPGRSSAGVNASIIVATYGDRYWVDLAEQRALQSAENQTAAAAEVIHVHGDTLAAARNEGAERATTPWLCFLDADDELHPRYLENMRRAMSRGALLNPAVQVVIGEKARPPRVRPRRPLREGNYLVIGTMVKAELFHRAGRFWEERAWEDWSLWMRCVALGGTVIRVPQAIYRAHERPEGRNSTVTDPEGLRDEIVAAFDRWKATVPA